METADSSADGPEAAGGPGETRPLPEASTVPAGVPAQDSPAQESPARGALQDDVEVHYGALAALYRLFDGRLREEPLEGPRPIGWTGHAEAVRALTDGRVHGDWEGLARLMVDPVAAGRPGDTEGEGAAADARRIRLIQAPEGTDPAGVVVKVVREQAAAGARTLVLAPAADALEPVLADLAGDPEILAARVETRDVPGCDDPRPERRVHEAVVRAVGAFSEQSRDAEIGRLRRELLWLEQWPRDRAALAAVRADQERRHGDLSAGEELTADEIRELRAAAAAAEQEAASVADTRDRLADDKRLAAEDAEGLRAEWEGLQEVADAATRTAEERTRVAEESNARYRALEQRAARGAAELEEARRRERSLVEELRRAEEALPEATAETERLSAASPEAAAAGHAAYYRMAAAESALAAERRNASLGQRLHLSRAHPELERLRKDLAALRREADDAATHARRVGEALEQAEVRRAELAAFLWGGDEQLAAAKREQQQLTAELDRAAADRDAALAEHRAHAELLAEAVELAAEAAEASGRARERDRAAAQRAAEAVRAHDQAAAEAERAAAEARTVAERAADSEAELERRRADSAEGVAADLAEVEAAAEAEARSRGHVREICGMDPDEAGERVLAGRRTAAMAAIERLLGHSRGLQDPADTGGSLAAAEPGTAQDGQEPAEEARTGGTAGSAASERLDPSGEVLLDSAAVVCGTAVGIAACQALATARFDTLVVADAGRITDGEFLIGAVRAGRWIMVGVEGQDTPAPDEDLEDHVSALAALHVAAASSEAGLEEAVESMTARLPIPANDLPRRRAGVRAEADRLLAGGLWEDRYRDAYEEALRSLPATGRAAEAPDPGRILLGAIADRLRRGPYGRAAATAPSLWEPPAGR